MKSEKYFDKAISILNKMGIKNENIIVTGSVALDILGVLPEDHQIHDFDCILNIDKDSIEHFKTLCDFLQTDDIPSVYEDNTRMIKFDGVLLNIWFNFPNEKASVTYKGVGVKDMMSIIDMKKKYKREKDYKDINQIIKRILI